MQDKARAYTDRKLEELEKKLGQAYARAKTDLEAEWKRYMEKHGKWADELYDALKRARMSGNADAIAEATQKYQQELERITRANRRYKRLVNDMSQKLAHIDQEAYRLFNGELPQIYAANYNSLGMPTGYVLAQVSSHVVPNLLMGELDLLKSVWWNEERLNAAILQGILQGESIPHIAKRLKGWVDGNYKAAVRAARTAVNYAENQGRLDSMRAAADIGLVYEKQWVATHDNRTRESHRRLDKTTAPLEERFANKLLCPGDPDGAPEERYNCRCGMKRILKGIRRPDGTFVPWRGRQPSENDGYFD